MKFSPRTVSAVLCVPLCLMGHICMGQAGPASSQTVAPVAASRVSEGTGAATKPPAGKATRATVKGASANASPNATSSSGKAYVIGNLDLLDIQVWNAANLSGFFSVGSDGMISMPLLGQIKAEGLTLAELNHLLREKLAASVFTEAPEVNVQLARNNSKKYTVFGAVLKPGEFPLNSEMTVMDAIGMFGGFREFANKKKIRVVRGAKTFFLNFEQVSHGKNLEQNIKLENGDWIFVDGG